MSWQREVKNLEFFFFFGESKNLELRGYIMEKTWLGASRREKLTSLRALHVLSSKYDRVVEEGKKQSLLPVK